MRQRGSFWKWYPVAKHHKEIMGLYDLVWITNGGCRKTKIVIDRIPKICTTEISPILNQLPHPLGRGIMDSWL